jgi:hypothetical protein
MTSRRKTGWERSKAPCGDRDGNPYLASTEPISTPL